VGAAAGTVPQEVVAHREPGVFLDRAEAVAPDDRSQAGSADPSNVADNRSRAGNADPFNVVGNPSQAVNEDSRIAANAASVIAAEDSSGVPSIAEVIAAAPITDTIAVRITTAVTTPHIITGITATAATTINGATGFKPAPKTPITTTILISETAR